MADLPRISHVASGVVFIVAMAATLGCGIAAAATDPATAHPCAAPQQPTAGELVRGEQIFVQDCAECHGPHGEGADGRSLKNEASRKNFAQGQAWIERRAPPMPTLYPSALSARDIRDVAGFVESLK